MSDGVGKVVGGEDRPGEGRYIHRQVGTYFLPVVEEGASQERQRERQREEAGPVKRSGELAKREREREGSHADHPCPASRANERRSR